jgi:hypothetical protein
VKIFNNLLPFRVSSGWSMGDIGKQRQLNETEWYRAVRDLVFYELRWILKFSFKHCLMNDIIIFLSLLKWAWMIFIISSLLRLFLILIKFKKCNKTVYLVKKSKFMPFYSLLEHSDSNPSDQKLKVKKHFNKKIIIIFTIITICSLNPKYDYFEFQHFLIFLMWNSVFLIWLCLRSEVVLQFARAFKSQYV